VWVADPGGRRLHMFDLQQRRYLKIASAGDVPLLSPVDISQGPGDSMWVCDSEDVAIHRFSATDGRLIETLRMPEDIRRPVALHYDDERKELFVVDAVAHDIKVLGHDGHLRRIIGQRGAGPGEFNFPCDIAEDGGRIWIADAGNNRVQALTPQGEPVVQFGKEGDAPGDMAFPKGLAFDSEGHAYVVDARFENIQIFDESGRLLLFLGQEGGAAGEFWLPSGIFVDGTDRIWVCDTYNGRVQVFQYVPELEEERTVDRAE
jgi:sugar lactone lactonase YvrE